MRVKPINSEGYRLLHEGSVALSEVERNGIRLDVKYIETTQNTIRKKREELRKELLDTKVWRRWRRMFGHNAKLGSDSQLRDVLFSDKAGSMGYEPKIFTKSGLPAVNQYNLESTRDPFVKSYIRWKKYDKADGTFLEGLRRECCDGFVHPFFNLNTALSYRSSSDRPNFQFNPVRDAEIAELVRKAVIPLSPKHALVENDFKGLEVGTSCCYNLDPKLIEYVKNPKLDMHRDMAMELFKLPLEFFTSKKPGSKEIRHLSKNGFVFPQFYGDWYKSVTPAMWESIGQRDLRGPDGKSLYEWLKRKGIDGCGACEYDSNGKPVEPVRGTFEHHVMKIENDFWGRRFKVYKRWKRTFWESYLKKGYFDSLTGFRYDGIVFEKNQVTNIPIQGSGFHMLLQTLIWYLKKNRKMKMGCKVGAQIHDSMFTNVPIKLLDEHSALMHELVSVKLAEQWKWINVPMEVETEISPPGTTWFDKRAVTFNSDMTTYNFNGVDYLSSDKLLEALTENILTDK